MQHLEHNGWWNYETWNCNLWLDNDGLLQDFVQDREEEVYTIESRLRDLVEELTPELPPSMFSDMLGASISEINFREIAENLLEDYQAEHPEEEESEEVEP